jgi:hypothetical protein
LPGCVAALNVVPVTPDHALKESEIVFSISSSWAGPELAEVRSVRGPGKEMLHWRVSGVATDRFQRSGCGHPPEAGIVVSVT